MSYQTNSTGGFGMGLLTGLAIGVGVGLLYAPSSGQRIIRMIREDAKDVLDAGTEQIQESKEQVNDMMDHARERTDRVIARAKRRAATE